MKKTLFSLLTFFLFSLIGSQAFANLIFEDSHLEADIQEDGTIKVQEFFDVNFLSEMHGIQREIPEYYTVDITKFKIFLDNVKVPGEHFEVLPYWKTKNIRIGDADILVYGKKNYEIDYDLYGVIRNFSGMGYSELYRNLLGSEREDSFPHFSATLHFPKAFTGLTKEDFNLAIGDQNYYALEGFPGTFTRTETGIYIDYPKRIPAYQGITLAMKFPNNYFVFDHEKQASLFDGYTIDYQVDTGVMNIKLSSDGTAKIQETWQIEKLNEMDHFRGDFPYYYHKSDGSNMFLKRNYLNIEGEEQEIQGFNAQGTTFPVRLPIQTGRDQEIFTLQNESEVFGLVMPFTWTWRYDKKEEEVWPEERYAFQFTLPLDLFTINEAKHHIVNIEFPEEIEKIYQDDISMVKGIASRSFKEIFTEGGKIDMTGKILTIQYPDWDSSREIFINLTTGFQLDQTTIEGLTTMVQGGIRTQSDFSFSSWILLLINTVVAGVLWILFRLNRGLPKQEKALTVTYDLPKGITPTEAGVLVDQTINPRDLSCMIYKRAIQKKIKMKPDEKDKKNFFLEKIQELDDTAPDYEKILFKEMFGLVYKSSANPNLFEFKKYKDALNNIYATCYMSLKKFIDAKGRYRTSISNFDTLDTWVLRKRKWRWIAGFLILIGIEPYILNDMFIPLRNGLIVLNMFFTGILILTNRVKEQELCTLRGQELRSQCLWYKEFLLKVDKKRLEEMLRQDPYYLEKVLPAAFAFGIQSELMEKLTPKRLEEYGLERVWIEYFTNNFSNFNHYLIHNPFLSYHYGSSISGSSRSNYSSSSGFHSGSSFSSGRSFHSWGGGWWGWGRGW